MDGIIIEKIPVNRFFKRRVKFHFGMFVWVAIAEKHNKMLDDLGEIDPEQLGADALYFAAKWGAFTEGKTFVSYEKFEKWLEFIPARQMNRITKAMQSSQIGGKTVMQYAQEGKKKQAQKK